MFAMIAIAAIIITGSAMSTRQTPVPHFHKAYTKVAKAVKREEPRPETDLHLYDCMNGNVVRYEGLNMVMVVGDDGEPIRCPVKRPARLERREQIHPDVIQPEMGPEAGECPGAYDEENGCVIQEARI